MARHVVTDTAEHLAVGVIHGLAGLGKTFATRTCTSALATRTRATDRIEVVTIAFPARPTMRLLADLMLQTLTGTPPARRDNRFYLTAALVRELARVPRLVVVDEAQRLPEECIELLRYLHDHDDTAFGLLYVGGNGCWEVLSRQPMLRSRVWRRQNFTPMSRTEVPQVMRSYHRLYADADDDLLHYIDDRFAHGIWRNWALFSSTAYLLAKRSRRTMLDLEIIDNAFALNAGGGNAS
ncbi:AAA family ATPase [Micromonospora arida]|uniref:AAA family ATPase n=1 Tax=Micromonospora arida TaxID=2203715 RepID=UPI003CE78B29